MLIPLTMQFIYIFGTKPDYARSRNWKVQSYVFCQDDVTKTCNHVISQIAFYTFRSIKTYIQPLYSTNRIVIVSAPTLHTRCRKRVSTVVRALQKKKQKIKEFTFFDASVCMVDRRRGGLYVRILSHFDYGITLRISKMLGTHNAINNFSAFYPIFQHYSTSAHTKYHIMLRSLNKVYTKYKNKSICGHQRRWTQDIMRCVSFRCEILIFFIIVFVLVVKQYTTYRLHACLKCSILICKRLRFVFGECVNT